MQANLHSPERRPIELAMEHADRDALFDRSTELGPADELPLRRRKRRQLMLRDAMQRVRGHVMPDVTA